MNRLITQILQKQKSKQQASFILFFFLTFYNQFKIAFMLRRLLWILSTIYKIQRIKYEKKGLFNTLIGFSILFCMFYFVTNMGKHYWPERLDNPFLFQLSWQWGLLFFSNIFNILLYLPGYLGAKFYKKYQIAPMPRIWQKEDGKDKMWSVIGYYILNNGIIFPFYLYLGTNVLGFKMKMEGFPSTWQVFTTVVTLLFVDDFIYMISHRLFHSRLLYRFHKQHHSVSANFSFIGNYNDPVDHYFGAVIPGTFGLALLRPHMFIAIFWFWFKLINISQGHSGYDFPWTPMRVLPFIYGNSYHEFHHRVNQGNFSTSLYVFQLIFGTNYVFFEEQFKKEGKEWVPYAEKAPAIS